MVGPSRFILPPEILDLIFGSLRDCKESLKACSQVDMVFSGLTERHLYHEVDVSYSHRGENPGVLSLIASTSTSKLSKLFHETPRLTTHVESLRIIFDRGSSLHAGHSETPVEDFQSMLSSLSRVKRIHVYRHDEWKHWTDLPQPYRLAVLERIQSVNTEEVCLNGLDGFPIHGLNKCIVFKHLSFSNVFSFDHELGNEPQALHYDPRHLQSLRVRLCDTSVLLAMERWFSHPTSSAPNTIRGLRSLTLRKTPTRDFIDLRWLSHILSACVKTLVSLEFDGSLPCL